MKRLVFCFDGTWDKLGTGSPTNVVLTAQSVSPVAGDGKTQIIHYDQGVGTTKETEATGGMFGKGLLDNIVRAYAFLIFNYEIGDEIFVFGFSRGAYTARSFAGLLRNVGILRRSDAGRITESVLRYQNRGNESHISEALMRYRLEASPFVCVSREEDAWRTRNVPGYVAGSRPVLRIRYVGVWDTVGSLGIPDNIFFAPLINKAAKFHDTELSEFVVSARHAVSIDEKRKSFSPTLWTNFETLNASLGFGPDDADAPYLQRWFPGDHGSVGGGAPERGLSDVSLDWIVRGARDAGLDLDTTASSQIFSLNPNPGAPLKNYTPKKLTLLDRLMKLMPTADRMPGPERISELSPNVIKRWSMTAAELPEKALYRPKTLSRVADALNNHIAAAGPDAPVVPVSPAAPIMPTPEAGKHYRIVRGDTLSKIAERVYGDMKKYPLIEKANPSLLDGPNQIYKGQIIYIPLEAAGAAAEVKAKT